MRDVARRAREWVLPAVIVCMACAPAAHAAGSPTAHEKKTPPGSQGHGYRHGVVQPRGHDKTPEYATAPSGSGRLTYGGGVNNGTSTVGVVTGTPKVYLVFWGSQWGTQGTNSAGNVTLTGDPNGMAPYLESFIKGIGTNNETWSGVVTQYCQGVSTGATSCPSTAAHVGYPSGGAFAGVWVDTSAAAPSQASGAQIGAEAVKAASHFGNTTQDSNLPAQYVIVSPTRTHPDGFNTVNGNFCAWHDYTGDTTMSGGAVASSYGDIAFTNLPYITDMGSSCGEDFVNSGSAGTLDGVSMVEGHEYDETLTDEYPAGGWTDAAGYENADKCAWITTGNPGASQNITLATGTFAVQSTYANDDNSGAGGCEITHAIVGGGSTSSNTVTVTNPGSQTATVGTAISPLQIQASDTASGQTLTYTASGLPAGLSISSSGSISGTPTTAGTASVTVTAKDSTAATGSTTFTWTVNSVPGSCTARQLLGNPGFETGTASPWTTTTGVISNVSAGEPAHSGSYVAWLDGYGTSHTDKLAQTVSIPSGCTTYTFGFWLHVDTQETTTTTAYDTLKVQVLDSSGTVVKTLATYSNLNAISGFAHHSSSLAAYAGQKVTLRFVGTEDTSLATSFVIDDTSLNVS